MSLTAPVVNRDPPSPTPPPSLSSLPGELLIQIALHLDPASAVSYSRVSKSCTAAAGLKIWRDLDFSVRPYDHDMLSFWQANEREGLGRELERKSGEKLRQRVKECMMRATQRRYEQVQSIRLEPRPAAVVGMLQLLDLGSPILSTLEIVNEVDETIRDLTLPRALDTLDVQMLRSGISFPALTHIRLGEHAIRFMGFLFLLCDHSPNLVSLDASLDQCLGEPWSADEFHPEFPTSLAADISIRKLRLFVRDIEAEDEDGDIELLQDFLSGCPKLEQLSLKFSGKTEAQNEDTLNNLASLEELRALYFPSSWFALDNLKWENGDCFQNLRRLVVRITIELDLFGYQTAFPNLEALFIQLDAPPGPDPADYGHLRQSCHTFHLIPSLTTFLRDNPRLRTLHILPRDINTDGLGFFDRLDALEASYETGSVMSIRRGDSELLHAHLLLNHREILDMPHKGEIPTHAYLATMFYKPWGSEGFDRIQLLERLEEPVWLDLVDFDKMMVPLELIEKVRIMEGVKKADWKGRGMEVGDRAWRLLCDWRDKIAPAQQKADMEKEAKTWNMPDIRDQLAERVMRVALENDTKGKKKRKKKKTAGGP